MEFVKKTLHLNYTKTKGEKLINKYFAYDINLTVEDSVVKEVGEAIASLIDETIENYSISAKIML